MRHIICPGPTSYDVGFQHGSSAVLEIQRGIAFYQDLFRKTARLEWERVLEIAESFDAGEGGDHGGDWGEWREEMRGIADGASVPFRVILALNVRTEVAYGMSQDGCTAISCKTRSGQSFLAQNWDWQAEQGPNLIRLSIRARARQKPAIDIITEAGIIGKIGLNELGVGVCLNAIGANGVDFRRLPVHVALRACLESVSTDQAVERLQREGVASACHILVADEGKAVGVECSNKDVLLLSPDDRGIIKHTNHFLVKHEGVMDKVALKDSPERFDRLQELLEQNFAAIGDREINIEDIRTLLGDEKNAPAAICRSPSEFNSISTLFSILMDLKRKKAEVTIGRPSGDAIETIHLDPKADS